jgi:serine/threonine protein kinase
MKPSAPHPGSDDPQPDSLPGVVESGAISRSLPGAFDNGATITAYVENANSTDDTLGPDTDCPSTGRTSEVTGLLKGRLARPHTGHEKYVPGAELGRGGMGMVCRALDIDLRRDVAMKIMLPDARESKYARFIEEAQVTGQLEHPNIVPVHDLGIDAEQRPYFTMKLVNGQPLSELLARLRKEEPEAIAQWPLGRLLGAFMGVCNGIAYAHEHGVVHRDLKPANIMLGGFGEAQVMDWGLAKIGAVRHAGKRVQSLRDDLIRRVTHRQRRSASDPHLEAIGPDDLIEDDDDAASSPPATDNPFETRMGERDAGTMTHDGSVMGTPVYMPPEQARGAIDEIDERSDIYSLGAILYELLTLKPPISGNSARHILEKVKSGAIIPPERRTPKRHIPPELSAIAMKALARHPDDRYQRADALLRDVELFVAGKTVSAKEDSAWEAFVKLVKRNKPVSLAVGIAMLVFACTVTLGFSVVLRYWSAAEYSRDEAREALAKAEESRDQARTALDDFKREQTLRAEAERAQRELEVKLQEENRRNWHLVHDERFGPLCFDSWRAVSGWDEQPHQLDLTDRGDWIDFRPDGLHVAHDQDVLSLVYEPPLGDSIRLQLAITVDDGDCGGLSLVLRGHGWNRGYLFQVGGWDNAHAAILRGTGTNARTLGERPFSLLPGRRYQLEASIAKVGGSMQLALHIDGEEVLSASDSDPLLASGGGDCALILPAPAAATLHWARLSSLGAPLKEDLLATADRHLGKGNYLTAFDLYQEVAEAGTDSVRIGQARIGMERARELMATADKLTTWRSDLKRMWHNQQWSLDITESLLTCSISGKAIVRLNPLRGLPLNRLTLYHTQVGELSILAGMPLSHLMVVGGRIEDLGPLANLPLQDLTITGNPLVDLAPLTGLPLLHLDLSDSTALRDLGPLSGSAVEVLILNGCTAIDSLAPLRAGALHHLEIVGCTGLPRLDELASLGLRSLRIGSEHTDALLAILDRLPQLERITVTDGTGRPSSFDPGAFFLRYGLGRGEAPPTGENP